MIFVVILKELKLTNAERIHQQQVKQLVTKGSVVKKIFFTTFWDTLQTTENAKNAKNGDLIQFLTTLTKGRS